VTTNYDPIAEQYKRSKQTPWRTDIECHTLLETIGSLDGLAVLDVACGEGFYTRMLRHRGATRATGVDLSDGMVALARKQEEQAPLGIRLPHRRRARARPARDLRPSWWRPTCSTTPPRARSWRRCATASPGACVPAGAS
jgi:SAM-dependent methyltransferase